MSHSAPVTHDVPNGYMTDRGLHILHVSIYDSIGRGPKGWWSLFQTYRARGHGSWLAVGHKLGNDPNVLPRRSVITTNVRCPTLANFPLGLAKLAGHGPKRASNCRKEGPMLTPGRASASLHHHTIRDNSSKRPFVRSCCKAIRTWSISFDSGSTDGSLENHTQVRTLASLLGE